MPALHLHAQALQALDRLAVALQAGSPVTQATTAAGTTLADSIAVAAGDDLAILALLHTETASTTGSSVVRDGQNAFRIARVSGPSFGAVEAWLLLAPNVGTATLTSTWSATGTRGHAIYVLENVDQLEPLLPLMLASASGGTSSTLTVPQAATLAALLLDALGIDNTGHAAAVGADQTEKYDVELAAGAHTMAGSSQAGTAGGVMSWTWTGSNPFQHIAMGLRGAEDTGGGATPIAGTDAAGAETETADLAATAAGTDVDGANTETGDLAAALAGTDASAAAADVSAIAATADGTDAAGATTEAGSVTQRFDVAGTDASGPAVDQASATAALDPTDTGTAAETGQLTAAEKQAADASGPTTEAGAVLSLDQKTGTDVNGTPAEAASTSAAIAAADTGAALELAATAATAAGTDARGPVTEAGQVAVAADLAKAGTDTGTGTDTATVTIAVETTAVDVVRWPPKIRGRGLPVDARRVPRSTYDLVHAVESATVTSSIPAQRAAEEELALLLLDAL